MKKTIARLKWEKKLTKKELKHVRVWCGGSLRMFKFQRAQEINKDCFECRIIAQKLGIEGGTNIP